MELTKNALCKPVAHLTHRCTVPHAPHKTKVAQEKKDYIKNGTTKVRTYYNAKLKRKEKSNHELLEEYRATVARYKQIEDLYFSVGIPKEYHKAFNSLYYRFKYNNVYYNKLVNIYLQDNTQRDFFNMCYMVVLENDPDNFKEMWQCLRVQLETETAVNRRQKQKQAYKKLSLDELYDNGVELKATYGTIEEIQKAFDVNIIYNYIRDNLTPKQVATLRDYLSTNKKIDSRAKKRIIAKLKTTDFKKLLY